MLYFSNVLTSTVIPFPSTSANNLGSKLLVGYWHNFDNGTGIIKLKDVSPKWDVINVSFGETGGDRSTVEFSPVYGTDAEFKSDISYLKSKGKKVVLSIGGQNGVVLLPDNAAKDRFINSIQSLIDKYGFDGIDIDLESGIYLNGNDTNFKTQLPSNRKSYFSYSNNLRSLWSDFLLSMALKQLMFKADIAHMEAYGVHIYQLFTE